MDNIGKFLIILAVVLSFVSCKTDEMPVPTETIFSESFESSTAGTTSQLIKDSQTEHVTEPPETDPVVLSPLELPDDFYDSISLPKIEDFSGTEYEDYEYPFPPVESAILKCNGTETEISSDDTRLIRLLNFIMYGEQYGQTYWRQGYVLEDEINEYLSSTSPMLIVNFNNTPSNSVFESTPQIIISGNQYLIFEDEDTLSFFGEKVIAEQHFAYEGLFQEEAEQLLVNILDKISLEEQWSNPDYYWLDLIEYAGFIVE